MPIAGAAPTPRPASGQQGSGENATGETQHACRAQPPPPPARVTVLLNATAVAEAVVDKLWSRLAYATKCEATAAASVLCSCALAWHACKQRGSR